MCKNISLERFFSDFVTWDAGMMCNSDWPLLFGLI